MVETDDEPPPAGRCSASTPRARPTAEMLDAFDVVLVDLQDLGTRVYTFITTLLYFGGLRGDGQGAVDPRPTNPAGRPVEGTLLEPGQESFVGAGPLPMRHGLTVGELGRWYARHFRLDLDLEVIAMRGWAPDDGPASAALGERSWVTRARTPRRWPWRAPIRHGAPRRDDAIRRAGHDAAARGHGCARLDAPAIVGEMRTWRRSGSPVPPAACCFSHLSQHIGALCTACRSTSTIPPTITIASALRLVALFLKSLRLRYPTTRCGATFVRVCHRPAGHRRDLGRQLSASVVDDPAAEIGDFEMLCDRRATFADERAECIYKV